MMQPSMSDKYPGLSNLTPPRATIHYTSIFTGWVALLIITELSSLWCVKSEHCSFNNGPQNESWAFWPWVILSKFNPLRDGFVKTCSRAQLKLKWCFNTLSQTNQLAVFQSYSLLSLFVCSQWFLLSWATLTQRGRAYWDIWQDLLEINLWCCVHCFQSIIPPAANAPPSSWIHGWWIYGRCISTCLCTEQVPLTVCSSVSLCPCPSVPGRPAAADLPAVQVSRLGGALAGGQWTQAVSLCVTVCVWMCRTRKGAFQPHLNEAPTSFSCSALSTKIKHRWAKRISRSCWSFALGSAAPTWTKIAATHTMSVPCCSARWPFWACMIKMVSKVWSWDPPCFSHVSLSRLSSLVSFEVWF